MVDEEEKKDGDNYRIDKNWKLSYKNTREYAKIHDTKEIFQKIKHDYFVHINTEPHWAGSFLRSYHDGKKKEQSEKFLNCLDKPTKAGIFIKMTETLE